MTPRTHAKSSKELPFELFDIFRFAPDEPINLASGWLEPYSMQATHHLEATTKRLGDWHLTGFLVSHANQVKGEVLVRRPVRVYLRLRDLRIRGSRCCWTLLRGSA